MAPIATLCNGKNSASSDSSASDMSSEAVTNGIGGPSNGPTNSNHHQLQLHQQLQSTSALSYSK